MRAWNGKTPSVSLAAEPSHPRTRPSSVCDVPLLLLSQQQVADIYTHPAGLREELQGSLGTFPLHRFWGPGTSIESSKWTANAAVQVDKEHDPTLTLIYLPHLDYGLQKYGPPLQSSSSSGGGGGSGGGAAAQRKSKDDPSEKVLKDLREIDGVVEGLVRYYESEAVGARVVILSEYAIARVDRPVYLNRVLRAEGLVQVRTENGGETLDCGECRAFALCDHQVCVRVYVFVCLGQHCGRVFILFLVYISCCCYCYCYSCSTLVERVIKESE